MQHLQLQSYRVHLAIVHPQFLWQPWACPQWICVPRRHQAHPQKHAPFCVQFAIVLLVAVLVAVAVMDAAVVPGVFRAALAGAVAGLARCLANTHAEHPTWHSLPW